MTAPDDRATIAADAQAMATRLAARVEEALRAGDTATMRALWRRLLAIERAMQERELASPDRLEG